MTALTFTEIFGANATFTPGTAEPAVSPKITIDLNDFKNIDDGGQIANGLGINDPLAITHQNIDQKALSLLYGQILLASQGQDDSIHNDAERKLYVSDSGQRLGSGERNGQTGKVIALTIWKDSNINELPDMDDV